MIAPAHISGLSRHAADREDRLVFISTERTPNPEAMRFDPHVALTSGASWSFDREGFEPGQSALAAALFALDGVRGLFIAPDFLTVLRDPRGPAWSELRYQVLATLADHLDSGAPSVAASSPQDPSPRGEIEAEIRQVLDLNVRPAVARDGGDILFDRFDSESGVLRIRMRGACGGCPSSQLTLRAHVERIVRRYVPEVRAVEQVADDDLGESPALRMKRWLSDLAKPDGERPARTVFTHLGRNVRD
jgi:Fe-S cluster biogenesis protein NfuA